MALLVRRAAQVSSGAAQSRHGWSCGGHPRGAACTKRFLSHGRGEFSPRLRGALPSAIQTDVAGQKFPDGAAGI